MAIIINPYKPIPYIQTIANIRGHVCFGGKHFNEFFNIGNGWIQSALVKYKWILFEVQGSNLALAKC